MLRRVSKLRLVNPGPRRERATRRTKTCAASETHYQFEQIRNKKTEHRHKDPRGPPRCVAQGELSGAIENHGSGSGTSIDIRTMSTIVRTFQVTFFFERMDHAACMLVFVNACIDETTGQLTAAT